MKHKLQPYIGDNFHIHKILLIGESHYISDYVNPQLFQTWYEEEVTLPSHIRKQFDTRYIINDFLSNEHSKCYAIYRFPAQVLGDVLHMPYKQAFTYAAFCNYFQRPQLSKGSFQSIYDDNRDYDYAFQSFVLLYEKLQPQITFFLSKKAFLCFNEQQNNEQQSNYKNIYGLVHPSSAWWYKDEGKYGCTKMKQYLLSFLRKESP